MVNRQMFKITKKDFLVFLFTLYLICFTTYQLNKGFDDYIIKIVPFLLIIVTLIFNYNNIKISNLLKWFFCFWFFYIISIFWSLSNEFLKILLPNIFYLFPSIFCLQYIVQTKKDINLVFKCIIIALLYSIVVILLRGGINQIGTQRIGKIIGLSSNAVGMRLAIGTLLCLYMIHSEKKARGLYIFLLITFIFFGLFTGSRKASIMLLLGISICEIMMCIRLGDE